MAESVSSAGGAVTRSEMEALVMDGPWSLTAARTF